MGSNSFVDESGTYVLGKFGNFVSNSSWLYDIGRGRPLSPAAGFRCCSDGDAEDDETSSSEMMGGGGSVPVSADSNEVVDDDCKTMFLSCFGPYRCRWPWLCCTVLVSSANIGDVVVTVPVVVDDDAVVLAVLVKVLDEWKGVNPSTVANISPNDEHDDEHDDDDDDDDADGPVDVVINTTFTTTRSIRTNVVALGWTVVP